MAQHALFCDGIGNISSLSCCYPGDLNSKSCQHNFFDSTAHTFTVGCPDGDCINTCSDPSNIYNSVAQIDPYDGNGQGPIRRFSTCANVPSMAGYLAQNVLSENITAAIGKNVSSNATPAQLKRVTSAVTDCLTSTCRNARNEEGCRTQCSAVNLLMNNTTPDVQGVHTCLRELCTGGYDYLPYADADVVGIGVFASYIMQCMLVIILWVALSSMNLYKSRRQKVSNQHTHPTGSIHETKPQAEPSAQQSLRQISLSQMSRKRDCPTQQSLLEKFLLDFHKAQCYFSLTLQIASLTYGIFETNMLMTFMLTPLATNGILPVVATYLLVSRTCSSRSTNSNTNTKARNHRNKRAKSFPSLDTTLLTILTYVLSTIVYWILYSAIIPINTDIRSEARRYRAYTQFMYKLSALDACGGYSALAVCPNNFRLGRREIKGASIRLRVLTPIIWTAATAALFGTLAVNAVRWWRERKSQRAYYDSHYDQGE